MKIFCTITFLILLALGVAGVAGAQTVTRTSLDGDWQMAHAAPGQGVETGWQEAQTPAGKWLRAAVPGTVQAALLQNGEIPDPFFGENSTQLTWMEHEEWWLRRTFSATPVAGTRYRLEFDGVDYDCMVWLNGQALGPHRGMFDSFSFDVTDRLRPGSNTLAVCIAPPPQADRMTRELKTMTLYASPGLYNGWAYVHMLTAGIWRSVRLVAVPRSEITDVFVRTEEIAPDHAVVRITGRAAGADGHIESVLRGETFTAPEVRQAIALAADGSFDAHITVPHPRLWWPNGLGRADLYRVELRLTDAAGHDVDAWQSRTGIRTITTVPNTGGDAGWLPWTFTVNGKSFFLRGANWIPPEDVLLRAVPDKLRHDIWMAAQAHVQVLRVWGGGTSESDAFYDRCDENGILVWEESPLGLPADFSGIPRDLYQRAIESEIRSTRNHPSLAVYCGGNEFDANLPGNRDLVARYRTATRDLDGTRIFRDASPWGGESHDYDCGDGGGSYTLMAHNRAAFVGEFGSWSLPHIDSLRRFLPPPELTTWPRPLDGALRHHDIYSANDWALGITLRYAQRFGAVRSMEDFARQSQAYQAEHLAFSIGHFRASWPRLSGCMVWQMQDFWPSITNSLVDYYGVPKMAYYAVKRAYRPVSVAARFDSEEVTPGQEFVVTLHAMSDDRPLHGWRVQVILRDQEMKLLETHAYAAEVAEGAARQVGELRWHVPGSLEGAFALVARLLDDKGAVANEAVYWINLSRAGGPKSRIRIPILPAGQANTIRSDGQAVASHGAKRLALLVASAGGSGNAIDGIVSLHYDSGADETVRVSFTDWLRPAGETVPATAFSHYNTPDGPVDAACYLHLCMVNVDPSRTFDYIRLPAQPGHEPGTGRLRALFVFGMAAFNGNGWQPVDITSQCTFDATEEGQLLYGCSYPHEQWPATVSASASSDARLADALPRPTLSVSVQASADGYDAVVRNEGSSAACMVELDMGADRAAWIPADNYFWLEPGEWRRVALERSPGHTPAQARPVVKVRAWNE